MDNWDKVQAWMQDNDTFLTNFSNLEKMVKDCTEYNSVLEFLREDPEAITALMNCIAEYYIKD